MRDVIGRNRVNKFYISNTNCHSGWRFLVCIQDFHCFSNEIVVGGRKEAEFFVNELITLWHSLHPTRQYSLLWGVPGLSICWCHREWRKIGRDFFGCCSHALVCRSYLWLLHTDHWFAPSNPFRVHPLLFEITRLVAEAFVWPPNEL